MAAFSSYNQQHHQPLLLQPNPASILNIINANPQFSRPQSPQGFVHQNTCLDQTPAKVSYSNNNNNNESNSFISSKNNNATLDFSSSVSDKNESTTTDYEQVSQKVIPMVDKKRKCKLMRSSSSNSAQSKDMRKVRGKKQKVTNGDQGKKAPEEEVEEEAPKSYIHVRARRGQATDSHSLAERLRREKISERMKALQALVPGCDKITGKALMLDEIINYVQSLQNQVEFLSMRLASVNPMFYDFAMGLDSFMVRPDHEGFNTMGSQLPTVQECSTTTQPQVNIHPDNQTNPAANCYSFLDTSFPFLFQQAHMPNTLPQGNGQLLWDVDEQRQKTINETGFNNNLCSFH